MRQKITPVEVIALIFVIITMVYCCLFLKAAPAPLERKSATITQSTPVGAYKPTAGSHNWVLINKDATCREWFNGEAYSGTWRYGTGPTIRLELYKEHNPSEHRFAEYHIERDGVLTHCQGWTYAALYRRGGGH